MAGNAYTLVIGTTSFSSWSLRPWLLMKQAGIGFDQIVVPLRQPNTASEILKHSPSGQVPALKHGDLNIWDSLAIAEYLNERHPQARLWPADTAARATARSISAEMHSAFRELRYGLPMDFSARDLKPEINAQCAADIRRMVSVWCQTRAKYGAAGPSLFGTFSIADAMFAPVASRFTTYAIKLADYGDTGTAEAYRAMMMALRPMVDWALAG